MTSPTPSTPTGLRAVASVVADFLHRHERFLVTEESGLIHR